MAEAAPTSAAEPQGEAPPADGQLEPGGRASPVAPQEQTAPAEAVVKPVLVLVTTETDGGLDVVRQLAAEFSARSSWQVQVVAKTPDELRIDLQTAALAEAVPDIIWAPADQLRVLAATGLLQPVADMLVPADFLPSAVADTNLQGEQWGVPVTAGDQLVLLYNRGLVAAPPATTDELLSMSRPDGVEMLLAYDARDPVWFSAWLQGFGGSLRGADGQPTLNSSQLVQTLFFLKELTSREIVPPEIDAASAEAVFREGRAAMLATRGWALTSLTGSGSVPFEVGMAPLPRAAATGLAPAAGLPSAQIAVGKGVEGERRAAVKEFVAAVTAPDVQERIASEARRLPAMLSVLQGQAVQSDPALQALATAQAETVPLQVREPLLDIIAPRLSEVLAGERPPEEVVQEMQDTAAGTPGE